MEVKPLITIFTPTFNRKGTLERLYLSLSDQTNCNFKWLIVDDGSTDGTDKAVQAWTKDGKIRIEYHYQHNSGKMAAHNLAVQMTDTKLFMCVDSDDWLVKDAVEFICSFWMKAEKHPEYAGVIAYKGKSESEVIGNHFSINQRESTLSGLYENGFLGDTTLIFRTEVIKNYPFPQIKGEKFITEAFVYDQIDQEYRYYLMNHILTVCQYRPDGYTNNGLKIVFENPGGWCLYCLQKGNLSTRIGKKFKNYAWSVSYKLMAKKVELLPINPNNCILYYFSVPMGVFLYVRRKIKYGC